MAVSPIRRRVGLADHRVPVGYVVKGAGCQVSLDDHIGHGAMEDRCDVKATLYDPCPLALVSGWYLAALVDNATKPAKPGDQLGAGVDDAYADIGSFGGANDDRALSVDNGGQVGGLGIRYLPSGRELHPPTGMMAGKKGLRVPNIPPKTGEGSLGVFGGSSATAFAYPGWDRFARRRISRPDGSPSQLVARYEAKATARNRGVIGQHRTATASTLGDHMAHPFALDDYSRKMATVKGGA